MTESTQDFPSKSIEVIRDEMAQGGYYAKDFAFDSMVRSLKNPRIQTVSLEKNGEKYELQALLLDVANSAE